MRDKSKDKDFEGKPYYGFTNIKRLSNLDIMMGCFAVMAIGAVFHYFAIRYVSSRAKKRWGGGGGGPSEKFFGCAKSGPVCFRHFGWDLSGHSKMTGFRYLSESNRNGFEMHFESEFSPSRIQTLIWFCPWLSESLKILF